jgi:TRAP-type C4-dicarboxylate transport system permease small subunit
VIRIEKRAQRIRSLIDHILHIWAGLMLVCVTLLVLLQVVARFVFNRPLPWPEEVSQFFVVVSVFISLFLIENGDKYVSFDLFRARLPEAVSLIFDIVTKLFLLGVAIFLLNGQRLLYPFLLIAVLQSGRISLLWFHVPITLGLLFWTVSILYSLGDIMAYLRKRRTT